MHVAKGNNLSRVKVSNQAAIKELIYHNGPITRIDIAKKLGLTVPTITANINALLAAGIIREVGVWEKERTNGRKAALIDIAEESRMFIGIEMRGSLCRTCVVDYRGKLKASAEDDTRHENYEDMLDNVIMHVRKMLQEAGGKIERVTGIGICMPGLIDAERGILKIHPGYNWINRKVVQDVAERLNYHGNVFLENNSCARAVGAQLFKKELTSGCNSFAYFYVSHGIACPLVINDSALYGSIVGEGEVGHMVMNPDGPACRCGNQGCLEAFAGEKAVLHNCMAAINNKSAAILADICHDVEKLTIEDIIMAQKMGDHAVEKIVEQALKYIGIAVANIENFVRPDLLLLEGNLFQHEANRTYLTEMIQKNLYCAVPSDRTKTFFMDADRFSGARGAAAVAIRKELEEYIEL